MAHPLDGANRTELVGFGAVAGLGHLSRTQDRAELVAALDGDAPGTPCPLARKREMMERHIATNWSRLRTQLPGCNGKCVSFG
jgi:hypothetical protein